MDSVNLRCARVPAGACCFWRETMVSVPPPNAASCIHPIYYIDASVLLGIIPCVKLIWDYIRDPSGIFSISSLTSFWYTGYNGKRAFVYIIKRKLHGSSPCVAYQNSALTLPSLWRRWRHVSSLTRSGVESRTAPRMRKTTMANATTCPSRRAQRTWQSWRQTGTRCRSPAPSTDSTCALLTCSSSGWLLLTCLSITCPLLTCLSSTCSFLTCLSSTLCYVCFFACARFVQDHSWG